MQQRDRIIVSNISAEPMRRLQRYLLVDVTIPQIGTDASMTIPAPFFHASYDAGCRVVDAMTFKSQSYQHTPSSPG